MKLLQKVLNALLVVLLPIIVSAQCPNPLPTPTPLCADASNPGVTEITFTAPVNSPHNPGPPEQAGFTYFELQHSITPTGPWDSVNVATNSTAPILHNTAVHTIVNYYRIISHFICETSPGVFEPQESAPSSYINTILINSSVTDDTLITLNWNNNNLGNPGAPYQIYRIAPLSAGGGFTPFQNNIPYGTISYQDTLKECNDKALYRIRIKGPGTATCYSISPPDTVDLIDNTPPSLQLVDSVSFNTFLNKPLIGWRANPQKDIDSYVIVECQPGGYTQFDTVGSGARSYIDTNYIGTGSKSYSVYAVDVCGNASTDIGINCHNSIYLTSEVDVCEETVELLWNAYDDYNSGVSVRYDVYVSQGGAPPELIGSTTDTRFLHEDPITNTNLTYFVRAVEKSGSGPFTTISNVVNLSTEFLKAPSFSYLRRVTVFDRNQVKLEMYADVKADVKEYRVKRASDTLLSSFITIGNVKLPSVLAPSDSIVGYLDRTATTDISKYYYLMEALDSCGRVLDTSNYASSIRLRVGVNSTARTNELTWNNYLGWEGDVFGYRVFRAQDGVFDPDPIVTVFEDGGEETSYIDDISGLTEGAEGEFSYYVQAIEDEPSFPRLEPSSSKSNVVTITQQTQVYIPNAFTPEGLNPVFKPVFVFADIENYQLTIFSRSGEIVFETTNINAGWDGTIDGTPLKTDVYVYLLKYRSITGQKFQERGTINLIK